MPYTTITKSNKIDDIHNLYVLIYDDEFYGFNDAPVALEFYKKLKILDHFKIQKYKGIHLTHNFKNKLE